MANHWTKAQLRAIDKRGCNILVAAAAGSGKTAVLVERIIKRITDKDGIDVDRLVVVTFTKAAAAEMKQRIREALDTLIEKEPDNDRLVRQLTLINNAQITTIDSFCLNIVRNYFTDIDIDPGFRTADEGEIKLLENDVMEEMLEEYYKQADQTFFDLVQAYGSNRSDSGLVDIIMKLYRFSRSYPWPKEWFAECLSVYECENADENIAVSYLYDYVKRRFIDFERQYTALEEICSSPMGPAMYSAAITSDHAGINMVLQADSFEELIRRIRLISFDTLGRSRSKDISEEKKEYVKNCRNAYKDFVNKTLKTKIFPKEYSVMLEEIAQNKSSIAMLLSLAEDFYNRIQAEKRERNIIDFNDMEHYALEVLVKKENGQITYTKAAQELSEFYEEILIDEYQDSNMLQEVILTAVSRGKENPQLNNIYMVGDVKQSIYKFRLACPKLFQEKYTAYEAYSDSTENMSVKIELQSNFRSRENVLECSNDVFYKAMNPEFCGILYDDRARLNAGFPYPPCDMERAVSFGEESAAVIRLIDSAADENDNNLAADMSDRELEALSIAKEIKRLVSVKEDGSYYAVYDKKVNGNYRKITYSDIVVLTRTVTGWADTFVDVLMNQGIPAYCDSSEGYFEVREVKLLLNLLTVIDNPLQDIPMAAVMLSYFGGFDTEELTIIRVSEKEQFLYNTMCALADGMENAELGSKIKKFIQWLEGYRKKAELLPISDLLWELMYDTGYYDYVSTMPAGNQRQANLDMLYAKASGFVQSSYHGLFQFLRYIERLKKYEVDFAEASILGENENLVRVMSIHKSKGLEFPVVFVAGMGKQINQMDARGEVLIDTELGIGTNVINLEKRTKNSTLIKAAVARKLIQESISEELRVLYVAMTRAREKLYMTGVVKDAKKVLEAYRAEAKLLPQQDFYSYSYETEITTYFDMVMPVACMEKEYLKGEFLIETVTRQDLSETDSNVYENDELQAESDLENVGDIKDIYCSTDTLPPYPHLAGAEMKPKVTVSELKKMQSEADYKENAFAHDSLKQAIEENESEENDTIIPAFIKGEQKNLKGSERGTAYHRIMECLTPEALSCELSIPDFLDNLIREEKITAQQADCINIKDIEGFVKSTLGKRLYEAVRQNKVHKEQPFVFIDDTAVKNKGQLIQGVIDLYFEEEDGLVVVDYKTDKVKRGAAGEEELKKRYTLQLDYYAKALQQLTGKRVKECIIYSFTLSKEIQVKRIEV